jgi:hypothetical protein
LGLEAKKGRVSITIPIFSAYLVCLFLGLPTDAELGYIEYVSLALDVVKVPARVVTVKFSSAICFTI